MTPSKRPTPKKGSRIRSYHTAEPAFGLQGADGKVYKFTSHLAQPRLVYQGIERRGEEDRRNGKNERRSEWKSPTKANSTGLAYRGRRADPWRKYDPMKDRTIPKEKVQAIRQEAEAFITRTMGEKKMSRKALMASFRREYGGTYYAQEFIAGPVKYVLRLDVATNQLSWSSTRRRNERRVFNRRTTQQYATHDPSVN